MDWKSLANGIQAVTSERFFRNDWGVGEAVGPLLELAFPFIGAECGQFFRDVVP